MMKQAALPVLLVASALSAVSVAPASAEERLRARLRGFEEVPAVSTGASGTFGGKIADDERSIDFELTYEGIEGDNVTAAHIHIGQRSVNGGVSAFLCGGGGRPACPTPGGAVTGTIVAADVIGPTGAQQVSPGALDELIAAIRGGVTYVNVHSQVSPGGEIRGQIKGSRSEDDDD